MSNLIADSNEKMIKIIDGKEGWLKKFLYGVLFIIPIILTFVLTKMFFQQKEETPKTADITKDKNPEVYGEKNSEGTKEVKDCESLDKTLASINQTIRRKK